MPREGSSIMHPVLQIRLFAAGLLAVGMLSDARGEVVDAAGDALPARARSRVGTTRFRHGDTVTAIAFSPDGRIAATASRDCTVSVWEVESGREIARCAGHTGPVLAVAFAADGGQIISGGADGTLRVWRVPRARAADGLAAGEEMRCHRVTTEEVQTVAFAAGDSVAAAGTADGDIFVWDLTAGRQTHHLKQERQVYCLALSADGKRLAANNGARGLTLWDTLADDKARLLGEGAGVVASLAFAPDGLTLAAGYHDNHIVLWDVRKGAEMRALAGHERQPAGQFNGALSVTFSADGRSLASGGADNAVRLWEVETGRALGEAQGHRGWVMAVAFAPDGKHLLSGGADNTVRCWESATGREVRANHEPASPLKAVSAASDGRSFVLIESPDRLSLWGDDGKALRMPAALAGVRPSAAAFAPDGQTLAVAGADGRLRLWDAAKQALRTGDREAPRRMDRLAWSADGRALASYGPDHHIDIWDTEKGELSAHVGLQEDEYLTLAFDRQVRRLATASEANAIRLWDAATGREQLPIAGKFGGALALSFSADGRSLHAAGADGRVRLWELATRQTWRVFHTPELTAAAFTSDGRFLATAGADGIVHLWDATTGKERLVLRGHRGPVAMLSFAARAPVLFSAGRDTTAIVWDLSDLPPPQAPPPLDLSADEIEALWAKLAGSAPTAYDALQTLRRAPGQVVPHLRARLRPVKADFARMLADLDSNEYRVRVEAARRLAAFGRVAEKALRRTLEGRPSLEVRRRIEQLLEEMPDGPSQVLAEPREVRSVELLESIGSLEARRVLEVLAGGIEESELTEQARASLSRLTRQGTSRP